MLTEMSYEISGPTKRLLAEYFVIQAVITLHGSNMYKFQLPWYINCE